MNQGTENIFSKVGEKEVTRAIIRDFARQFDDYVESDVVIALQANRESLIRVQSCNGELLPKVHGYYWERLQGGRLELWRRLDAGNYWIYIAQVTGEEFGEEVGEVEIEVSRMSPLMSDNCRDARAITIDPKTVQIEVSGNTHLLTDDISGDGFSVLPDISWSVQLTQPRRLTLAYFSPSEGRSIQFCSEGCPGSDGTTCLAADLHSDVAASCAGDVMVPEQVYTFVLEVEPDTQGYRFGFGFLPLQ